MDNAAFQTIFAQLAEIQQILTDSHNDFRNMRAEERSRKRAKKRDKERTEERNRKSIQRIGDLKKEEDFHIWRDRLINACEEANFHDYILREVPEPADKAEKRKWKKDRAAIDEYIRKAVPDRAVWATLEAMGWDITEQNPKSTFNKLTQYFNEDTHEVNYLLCRELFTIKAEDYDNFSTFLDRLNYLRQRLSQSKSWKLTEDAATMCALNGIATAHPELYRQTILNTCNNELSWFGLMSEFSTLSTD
jgi:hypothetical protein